MKLYLVPTPVGNMDDMTFRAIKVLKEVDVILAEDTRTSSVLLKHFGIEKKAISHHKFTEHQTTQNVVNRLKSGETIALISDAGTPGISDPGFFLVRECIANDIEVECLPGATALIPALVDSGLPTDSFCFEGFLPVKKGRQTKLKQLAEESRTVVIYESPHRVIKTLEQLKEFFGEDRRVSVTREISKIYEQTVRGTVSEVLTYFTEHQPKGEFVMVIEGKDQKKSS